MTFIKLKQSDWQRSLKEFQQRSYWVWLGKSQRDVISVKNMMQAKTYYKISKKTSLVKVSKVTAAFDINQYVIAGSIGNYNHQGE